MNPSGTQPISTSDDCGCSFGLVNPPASNPTIPMFESRINQFMRGELMLCGCERGDQYRAYLEKHSKSFQSVTDTAEAQRRAALWKRAGVPPMYANMTIKSYLDLCGKDPGKQEAIKALRAMREELAYKGKGGLLLWGEPGVGKTGALSPLLVYLLGQGCSGLWVTYPELMARLRNFESDENKRAMEECKQVDYLFIDDIGDPNTEKGASDYARDCFFRLLDDRKNNFRPILATSNMDLAGLGKQFYERIAQRLGEVCSVVEVKGAVLRK